MQHEYQPRIIELDPAAEGDRTLSELMDQYSSNDRDQPFLFIVPDTSAHSSLERIQKRIDHFGDNLPPPRKDVQYQRALKMKWLRDRRYSYKEIAKIMGFRNHATVLLTLKRHGLWEPSHRQKSDDQLILG